MVRSPEAIVPKRNWQVAGPFLQLVLIVLTALLLTFPCLKHGIPRGHDSTVHASYQHHFSGQFWNGDPYPRWLCGENKGGGSPIFLIQYPLPYFVTAFIRPLLALPEGPRREVVELGVYLFLAMAGAGMTARCWFRSFAAPLSATLAAVAYLALPYFTILVYVRTSIGELTAVVWMPLLLYGMERAASCGRGYLTISLATALLIASNVLITLLFLPVVAAYAAMLRTQPEGSPPCKGFSFPFLSVEPSPDGTWFRQSFSGGYSILPPKRPPHPSST
ncbi:hypothetical protein L4X63_14865 [Geomonas sp. Red32]|uniref:hypothetical protein n=1 Tax=Geomonas sp. Red32 TaxID=2912856 RepID=UPI00202CA74E|nr:hypothetical protein [Geomonas sp. Red32]MCM0082874.1 hypothetical protein [Geomonas sp. Red32]